MAKRKNPWMKFYPSDWRADPALRMCSMSARGLWIDMLGFMHEAESRGDLIVAGRCPSPEQLAALIGATADEVRSALEELETAGVFSRRKNGVIYSRRIERDENLERKNRENGKKGGNPSLCKQTEKEGSVKGVDKAQIPDTRYQIPEEEGGAGAPGGYAFEGKVIRLKRCDFDKWRESYPKVPDLTAELEAADAWYAEHPPKDGKWFFPVSSWLKRANNEAAASARDHPAIVPMGVNHGP